MRCILLLLSIAIAMADPNLDAGDIVDPETLFGLIIGNQIDNNEHYLALLEAFIDHCRDRRPYSFTAEHLVHVYDRLRAVNPARSGAILDQLIAILNDDSLSDLLHGLKLSDFGSDIERTERLQQRMESFDEGLRLALRRHLNKHGIDRSRLLQILDQNQALDFVTILTLLQCGIRFTADEWRYCPASVVPLLRPINLPDEIPLQLDTPSSSGCADPITPNFVSPSKLSCNEQLTAMSKQWSLDETHFNKPLAVNKIIVPRPSFMNYVDFSYQSSGEGRDWIEEISLGPGIADDLDEDLQRALALSLSGVTADKVPDPMMILNCADIIDHDI